MTDQDKNQRPQGAKPPPDRSTDEWRSAYLKAAEMWPDGTTEELTVYADGVVEGR